MAQTRSQMNTILTICSITITNQKQDYLIIEESFLTYCQIVQLNDDNLTGILSCCLKKKNSFVLNSVKSIYCLFYDIQVKHILCLNPQVHISVL